MGKLEAGTQVTPSLRLVRPLGEGGMGSVWIADHTGLRTQVVVKFMSDELVSSADALSRFSREAAAAALVKSPHVVQMIDHGVLPDGVPFIAMELMEGEDLGHRIAREKALPPRQLATLVSHVSKALARAHERGVVHRDIKPDNIFLSDGGGGEAFGKVLDFGIAKLGDHTQLSKTKTGAAIGTPYYMSPEQMTGLKDIDYRTDLWSLGVVAFEALTGKRPFEGETVGALALAICSSPLPIPSTTSPTLPVSVDAWFARACAREVGARFANAKELADAFEAAVGGSEPLPFEHKAAEDLAHAPTAVPVVSAKSPSTTTNGPVSDAAVARSQRRSRAAPLAAGLAVASMGVLAFFAWRSSHDDTRTTAPRPDPPVASSVVSVPSVAVPAITASAVGPPPLVVPSASASVTPPVVVIHKVTTSATAHASSSAAPANTDPFGRGSR